MKTIHYTERVDFVFGLTPLTLEKCYEANGWMHLEERTHNYLIQWYNYTINGSYITVRNMPVSEIESVIRIVNGFNEIY